MIGHLEPVMVFSDLTLARRLEKTEARANARFVEARARAFPNSGAQWIEVAGAYAMFDMVDSPVTQTFGFGLFETPTRADLERIERFFQERGARTFHEVCPLADAKAVALLGERGYRPVEFTSVMYRPIHAGLSLPASRNEMLRVRRVSQDEQELYAQIAVRGWSDWPEFTEFIMDAAKFNTHTEDAVSFFAELEGQPIATAALCLGEGVALLAGGCTVPERRRQGAQLALLETRLRHAADQGCDIAMMGAQPGSASQRNAERHGFRIAYTRIKWGRSSADR